MRFGLALILGFALAFALVQLPALATSQAIDAHDNTAWTPNNVTIDVGDSITWMNTSAYSHNVCVRAAGATSGCGEYRSSSTAQSTAQWQPGGYAHQFSADGTYQYLCQFHAGMTGTITVGTG